jgi:hypothetical protein
MMPLAQTLTTIPCFCGIVLPSAINVPGIANKLNHDIAIFLGVARIRIINVVASPAWK